MELVDLPDDQRLVRVEREWYAKGFIYACQDVRRELLILSQRVTYLQQAIEQLCNQTPSMTSPPNSPPPACPEGYHRVDGSIKDNCAECQLGTYQDQNESMVLSCYPCPFHTFAPTMRMSECIRELARLARPIDPAHTAADAPV